LPASSEKIASPRALANFRLACLSAPAADRAAPSLEVSDQCPCSLSLETCSSQAASKAASRASSEPKGLAASSPVDEEDASASASAEAAAVADAAFLEEPWGLPKARLFGTLLQLDSAESPRPESRTLATTARLTGRVRRASAEDEEEEEERWAFAVVYARVAANAGGSLAVAAAVAVGAPQLLLRQAQAQMARAAHAPPR